MSRKQSHPKQHPHPTVTVSDAEAVAPAWESCGECRLAHWVGDVCPRCTCPKAHEPTRVVDPHLIHAEHPDACVHAFNNGLSEVARANPRGHCGWCGRNSHGLSETQVNLVRRNQTVAFFCTHACLVVFMLNTSENLWADWAANTETAEAEQAAAAAAATPAPKRKKRSRK